jgi:DNA-binding response OmpR family regulator
MSLRGLRVLVVEDVPTVAEALQYLLEEHGMVVVGPVPTTGAAERLLARRPHLALVDVHLEGQPSHAFVRRLGELDVPVIAISGSAELLAGSPGAATLQKPFSGQELMEAVHRLVRDDVSPVRGQPEAGQVARMARV